MLILKMTLVYIYFFCSHPKGFGCAAQKEQERKALSCVFATKTRESVHLSNGTDATSGTSGTGLFIYLHSSLESTGIH